MTTVTTVRAAETERFQTDGVLTISAGHAVHDTHIAFLAPLLTAFVANLRYFFVLVPTVTASISSNRCSCSFRSAWPQRFFILGRYLCRSSMLILSSVAMASSSVMFYLKEARS